jgi:hypothetical protein
MAGYDKHQTYAERKEGIKSLFQGFVIDEKLAQHHELPRREKKFHWSKINQSENQKTTSTVIEDKNHDMVDHINQIKQILRTNDSSMSGESKHV